MSDMTRFSPAFVAGGSLVGSALLCAVLSRSVSAERPAALARNAVQTASGLVTTAATVRERDGRLVTNLGERDFVVEEDGHPQALARFASERTPLSVAIAIDTSQSVRGEQLQATRAAVQRFIETALRPDDEVALVSFNHSSQVIASWTLDRTRLRTRLDALTSSGSTALYDAVFKTLSLFTARSLQRAAMIIVSDGADSASDTTPTLLKKQLTGTDVFLYWIAVDHVDARPATRVNPYTLASIAAQGNGYSEVIHDTGDLGAALARVADELDHQYMLAYAPTTPADGRFHTLRVKVPSRNLVVRARQGIQR
jgi:Ca-activated chloride channel homolog